VTVMVLVSVEAPGLMKVSVSVTVEIVAFVAGGSRKDVIVFVMVDVMKTVGIVEVGMLFLSAHNTRCIDHHEYSL
jgi:hypothetical protein